MLTWGILAINLIQRPWFEFPDSTWLSLKQEVETLGPTSHVSQYFQLSFPGQLISIAPCRGVCICVFSKGTSGDFRGRERRKFGGFGRSKSLEGRSVLC